MGKKRTGRPRIEIDWEQVNKLCAFQCTHDEIAWFLGVSEDTLSRACKRTHKISFADYIAQKRGAGRVSLRRAQWMLALKGNPTMLIFLGKQYLGQADKVEQKNIDEERPLEECSDEELMKLRGDG